MIIQITLRYHVLLWRGRVSIQRCHLRCLASLNASISLVSCCLQVVVVAVIVGWDGLPGCCDVYWLFHGRRHLRKGCWSLYVQYDLLQTGMHLLWLWGFLDNLRDCQLLIELISYSHVVCVCVYIYIYIYISLYTPQAIGNLYVQVMLCCDVRPSLDTVQRYALPPFWYWHGDALHEYCQYCHSELKENTHLYHIKRQNWPFLN